VIVAMRTPRVKRLSCGSKTWHQPSFAEGQWQVTKEFERCLEAWLSRLTIQDVVDTFGVLWNTVCGGWPSTRIIWERSRPAASKESTTKSEPSNADHTATETMNTSAHTPLHQVLADRIIHRQTPSPNGNSSKTCNCARAIWNLAKVSTRLASLGTSSNARR